jgi:predicted transcriptional regulator of viral defense system
VNQTVPTKSAPPSTLDFFAQHAVFTREEFVRALDPKQKRSPRTLETILSYHTRQGRLLRVRRGLYANVPRPMTAETVPIDPLLLVGKIAADCVIAYHSALEHHGRVEEVGGRLGHRVPQAARGGPPPSEE